MDRYLRATKHKEDEGVFEEGAISEPLYDWIVKTLPAGSTILELGSGWGTSQLVKHYTVYSVEHDPEWWDKYHDNYFHVPLTHHKPVKNFTKARYEDHDIWYDANILREDLKGLEYDLLLIDGPPGVRAGFIKYFSLFDPTAIIVLDDVNRRKDYDVLNSIASKLKAPYVTYGAGCGGKLFGVINDPCTR